MSNFSLGVDIEEVARFKSLLRNKRFLKRVFSRQEIQYCFSKKNKAQHLAVRFAAKEAVWKAMSDIIVHLKKGVAHHEIRVKNTSSGKPEVSLPPPLSRWGKKIQISLSHTRSYAMAVALVKR